MAKLSRSAFFSVLVSTGAFVLAGCGGSTEKNSNYAGAYRSAYTVPSLNEAGIFTFTVDVKGNLSGTLDNQSGTLREVSGKLESDGRFSAGTLNRVGNLTGRISGTMAAAVANVGIGAPPSPTPVTGGNFALVENNTTTAGSFRVQDLPIVLPTPAPGASASAYQGYYAGIYNVQELKQNGNTSFSVDSTGKMTGLLTRDDDIGTLSGTLQNGGNFTGTVAFRQEPAAVTIAGTLVQTADRSTLGNFTLTQNNIAYAGTFGPTTVTSGTSPFAGSYRGTYSIPEGGEDGAISFTVDPAGAISGFLARNNNSPVGTLSGAFNNNGSFAGTVTYDPSSGIAPRPIAGRIGTSTLTNERAGDFVITINGVAQPGNFEASTPSANPDSDYRAAYTDGGIFGPAVSFGGAPTTSLTDTDSCEFSVDKQGSIVGSFGTSSVSGRVTNDARITGVVAGANGRSYPFRGVVNKVTWTVATGATTTQSFPGIKGDLIFSVDGKEYNGFLKATGGDGVTR